MSKLYFFILFCAVALGSFGQILLKAGTNKLNGDSFSLALSTLPRELWRLASIYEISLGFMLFFVSSLLWIKGLTKVELSTAYPLVSLGYINVAVCSYFFFHESFTPFKLLGIILIIAGVMAINN